LRQEFRDLEILDDITRLRFVSELDVGVIGLTRSELIVSYRAWKGTCYVPDTVPDAIKWSEKDLMSGKATKTATAWVAAKGSKKLNIDKGEPLPSTVGVKRKRGSESGTQWRDSKRTKPDDTKSTEECVSNSTISENLSPEGLIWSNNSCGYDSVFTILYQIWLKDPHVWSGIYKAMNTEWMGKLADGFEQYKSGQSTLEI
ncbi:hypothetical protein ARMGADRAFT_909407, partial [Armillaria gallica]